MTDRNRSRFNDVAKLRMIWPLADDIRYEGKCDSCKHPGLYSYTLPGDGVRRNRKGEVQENCGYYCAACGWGNGGSRKADDGGDQ